jgi:microsomal epoxide hydrolase
MSNNRLMNFNYKNLLLPFIWGVLSILPLSFNTSLAHQLSMSKEIKEKTFVTSDGIKISYLAGGQGEVTLLFIPGWLMPAEIFNSQLNYFSKSYKVISFSPRSQGKSDVYTGKNLATVRARDIKEILQYTEAKRFVLIGWSLGVMEALDYINRFGAQGLESLVLIDNSIGEGTPPKATAKSSKPMTTPKFISFAKGFVKAIFKSDPPADFMKIVENSALRLADKPSNAFSILHKPYPREFYKDTIYATPVPIWYAITPRYSEQALIFAAKHPQGEMTIYEHSGHALFVDQATEFNQDLESFLGKLN